MKITIAAVLVLAAFTKVEGGAAWEPEPRPEAAWIQLHEWYKGWTEALGRYINCLFVGDTNTYGWYYGGNVTWNQTYAPKGCLNYGMSAERTQNLLWRIDDGELDGLSNVKVVVLSIGAFNLYGGDSTDNTTRGVEAVVNRVLRKCPTTKLILLSMLPLGYPGWITTMLDLNSKIAQLADGRRVFYLNMFDSFCKGWAQVDDALFNPDLIYLNAAGYEKWAETMTSLFSWLYDGCLASPRVWGSSDNDMNNAENLDALRAQFETIDRNALSRNVPEDLWNTRDSEGLEDAADLSSILKSKQAS